MACQVLPTLCMTSYIRQTVLPALLDEGLEPLAEVVEDVRSVFELVDSRILLVDHALRNAAGESIFHPRRIHATVHPRAFREDDLSEALLDATSRIYDWAADASADPNGERHTYLVPIEASETLAAPADAETGFLAVEGLPGVVQIFRRCLTRALARGARSVYETEAPPRRPIP